MRGSPITSASCQAAVPWFAETQQPRFEDSCGWWEANFQHCSFKLLLVSCAHPGNRFQRVLFAPRGTTWILCQLSQACSSLFSWPMDWYLRRRLRSCIRPLVLCCKRPDWRSSIMLPSGTQMTRAPFPV